MGKKRGKTTRKRKSLAKKRSVRRVPIRKTQRKRHNPKTKKKIRKSPPRRNPPRSKKSKRLGTRITGNSTRIKVDSRYAGRNVSVLRKTSKFSPGLRVAKGANGPRSLNRQIGQIALRHFNNIGTSEKSYYYARIQYLFKLRGKKMVSHFSVGIAKLKNSDQFRQYISDMVQSFCESLVGYSRDGFSQIRVTAIIVQGYKK